MEKDQQHPIRRMRVTLPLKEFLKQTDQEPEKKVEERTMAFQVQYGVPYEGTHMQDFPELDQALDWISNNAIRYNGLDNMELLEVRHLDIYGLIQARSGKETESSHPLLPPANATAALAARDKAKES